MILLLLLLFLLSWYSWVTIIIMISIVVIIIVIIIIIIIIIITRWPWENDFQLAFFSSLKRKPTFLFHLQGLMLKEREYQRPEF